MTKLMSRRTALRGLGVSVSLPWLEAMGPLTAWAGEATITRVEVSTDNGSTWSDARLGTDEARWAWRGFQHYWDARETGSFVLHARAHDNQGRVQPITAAWNPNGYLWNAVDRVRINVG